jgi:hypothetical protein
LNGSSCKSLEASLINFRNKINENITHNEIKSGSKNHNQNFNINSQPFLNDNNNNYINNINKYSHNANFDFEEK